MSASTTTAAALRAELDSGLELLLERVADSKGSAQALERAAERCSRALERWIALDDGGEGERAEVARRIGLVVRLAQAELQRTGARLERATAVQRALVGRGVATDEPQRCDHRA